MQVLNLNLNVHCGSVVELVIKLII
jgi:hypothetical protein